MNGLQNILGGLIAYGFSFVPADSPLKSWQALFMSYGIITVIWAVFVGLWMPDSPMRAKCWTEEDKRLMIERVRQNQTGLQNRVFRLDQVRDAFTDPQRKSALPPFCRAAVNRSSVRLCHHPDLHYDSSRWHRSVRQHHHQILRLQHARDSAADHGQRRRNHHCPAHLCISGPQVPANNLHHARIPSPLRHLHISPHRRPLQPSPPRRPAHRLLVLLLLLHTNLAIPRPALPQRRRPDEEVRHHRLQLRLLGRR